MKDKLPTGTERQPLAFYSFSVTLRPESDCQKTRLEESRGGGEGGGTGRRGWVEGGGRRGGERREGGGGWQVGWMKHGHTARRVFHQNGLSTIIKPLLAAHSSGVPPPHPPAPSACPHPLHPHSAVETLLNRLGRRKGVTGVRVSSVAHRRPSGSSPASLKREDSAGVVIALLLPSSALAPCFFTRSFTPDRAICRGFLEGVSWNNRHGESFQTGGKAESCGWP